MADITLVAGVVLKNTQGKYLLVQEAKAPVHGLWNWPAGKLDPGETLQQAAIREAKEETGLDIQLIDQRPFYKGQGSKHSNHATHLFRGKVLGGRVVHQPGELLDVQWFSPAEIRQLAQTGKTRGEWVVKGVDMVETVKV